MRVAQRRESRLDSWVGRSETVLHLLPASPCLLLPTTGGWWCTWVAARGGSVGGIRVRNWSRWRRAVQCCRCVCRRRVLACDVAPLCVKGWRSTSQQWRGEAKCISHSPLPLPTPSLASHWWWCNKSSSSRWHITCWHRMCGLEQGAGGLSWRWGHQSPPWRATGRWPTTSGWQVMRWWPVVWWWQYVVALSSSKAAAEGRCRGSCTRWEASSTSQGNNEGSRQQVQCVPPTHLTRCRL